MNRIRKLIVGLWFILFECQHTRLCVYSEDDADGFPWVVEECQDCKQERRFPAEGFY